MRTKCLQKSIAHAFVVFVFSIAVARTPKAAETGCPFASQKQMLIVQLFFGQSDTDRRRIPQKKWHLFLKQTVTPLFPDGFTVYDAYGQWMNPRTHSISREKTKVIVIATEDSPVVRTRIDELSNIYRDRFHQQSIGIITSPGCGVF
jgi:hypothetical protein